MKSRCILASLSALCCLLIVACGSSSSPSEDTGGRAATGGAANTGAGGAATGNGGSAGLSDSGVAGRGSGGTAGARSGDSAAGGGGGSLVAGTGGALGDAGSLGAAGATGGAGSGGSAAAGSGGSLVGGMGGALGGAGSPGAAGATGAGGGSGSAGVAGPVAGTTSIFDGKTLNGWEQGTPMLWSVVGGVIDGKGTTGGQLLMTDADYGDFRIVVSSNMVAVGGTGHLGICFWGGRTPVGGYNDCKLIIPDSKGDTWDYSLNSGLKGVTKVGTPAANPTWNTTEILCFLARGFCRVAMNGTAVLTYQEPNLKSIKAGPIGLQIHDGKNEEVQYKDVYVDPAPTIDQLLTVK